MADSIIMFTKPASEKALASPINIEVSSSGIKITSGADILKESAWDDNKVSVTKAEINNKLNDYIIDRDRAARPPLASSAGGGGSSAPLPPTPLDAKKLEATAKMNAAITAANAVDSNSITEPQKDALLKKIADAVSEDELNTITTAITNAGNDGAALKAGLSIVGGKRRRKTNKRARKGKRGTRRHL